MAMEWINQCLQYTSRCHKEGDFYSHLDCPTLNRFQRITPDHTPKGHHPHQCKLRCRGLIPAHHLIHPDQMQECKCLTCHISPPPTHTNLRILQVEGLPPHPQCHNKMQCCTAGLMNPFNSQGLHLGQVRHISSNNSHSSKAPACLFNPARLCHSHTTSHSNWWVAPRLEA